MGGLTICNLQASVQVISHTNTIKMVNKENMIKLFRLICYLTCLGLFLIWLMNAVQNYMKMPKTTNMALRYGDDNKKNATFPSITFCKVPMWIGQELWNEATPCSNNVDLSPPYFLSYLEVCLESGINLSVAELVEKVTYNKSKVIKAIQMFPPGRLTLKLNDEIRKDLDKTVLSTFHYMYGNCLTVDISSVSDNDGMFPMQYQNGKLTIIVHFSNVEFNGQVCNLKIVSKVGKIALSYEIIY